MKIKRFTTLLLVFALSLPFVLLAGCGKTEVKAAKPISDIYAEISENVDLPEQLSLNAEDLTDYLGISPELYDEYTANIPLTAILGDMLLIFKAKDSASLELLETKISNFRAQKSNEMNNYLPVEYDKINASKIEKKGLYIWLVVSDDAASILSIIKSNIK